MNSALAGALSGMGQRRPVAAAGPWDVVWTSVVNSAAVGNTLTKNAGVEGTWDAGAISTRTLASGDGYVECTAVGTNTARICGLGIGNTSAAYTDVNFACYLRSDGVVQVYENGTNRGTFGSYANGDTLRVAVVSGVVKYSKNGTVFYTSGVSPTYPILVDTSLNTKSPAAHVDSVIVGGGAWS